MDIGYNREYTPDSISELKKNEVFVFGSNRSGFHIGGSAKIAKNKFGAIYGQAEGLQGQSYAIPTFSVNLDYIRYHVEKLINFAKKEGKELKFFITQLGCGEAGYTPYDIAPLFVEAVGIKNIILPKSFVEVLRHHPRFTGIPRLTWDAHFDFLDKYSLCKQPFLSGKYYEDIKQLRINTYWNTVQIANLGFYYTELNRKVELDNPDEMKKGTVFYSKEFSVKNIPSLRNETIIKIVEEDCIKQALHLTSEGYNPAVLNMASNSKPGGGVLSGSAAQEESIFRRTNIFQSLYQFAPFAEQFGIKNKPETYPMNNEFGGIYTPKAMLFRDTEKNGYKLLDNPQHVSFITVAAIKNPTLVVSGLLSKVLSIHPIQVPIIKNKIRTILRIGLRHRHDSLVLGAWGCGAYANPPQHIAALFHEVLLENEFKNKYRKIVFAIIDDHNTHKAHNHHGNLLPFIREFGTN